jgi:hypothetical protein
MSSYEPSKEELESIPGIGKSLACDLRSLGCTCVCDLKDKDPEKLYEKLNELKGTKTDPCTLYAFRCATYYAKGGRKPELLKWWNWKDKKG